MPGEPVELRLLVPAGAAWLTAADRAVGVGVVRGACGYRSGRSSVARLSAAMHRGPPRVARPNGDRRDRRQVRARVVAAALLCAAGAAAATAWRVAAVQRGPLPSLARAHATVTLQLIVTERSALVCGVIDGLWAVARCAVGQSCRGQQRRRADHQDQLADRGARDRLRLARAAADAARDGSRPGQRAATRRARHRGLRRAWIANPVGCCVADRARRRPHQERLANCRRTVAERTARPAARPRRRRHVRLVARSRRRLSHHRPYAHSCRLRCERRDRAWCRAGDRSANARRLARAGARWCADDRRVRHRGATAGVCAASGGDGPCGGARSCDRTPTACVTGVVRGGAVPDLHRPDARAQCRLRVVGRCHRCLARTCAAVAHLDVTADAGMACRRTRRADCGDSRLRATHRVDLRPDQPRVDPGKPARRARCRARDDSRCSDRRVSASLDRSCAVGRSRRRHSMLVAGVRRAHLLAPTGRRDPVAERYARISKSCRDSWSGRGRRGALAAAQVGSMDRHRPSFTYGRWRDRGRLRDQEPAIRRMPGRRAIGW